MVVRVSLGVGSAGALIERLVAQVEAEAVSLDRARQQVCINGPRDPDRALVRILGVVEDWLADDGQGPTKIVIDDRSYVLGPSLASAPILDSGAG